MLQILLFVQNEISPTIVLFSPLGSSSNIAK